MVHQETQTRTLADKEKLPGTGLHPSGRVLRDSAPLFASSHEGVPTTDNPLHILMVEDVAADAVMIERELRRANMPFVWQRVETQQAFFRALEEFAPDVILADYTLPDFSALEVLRVVKERRLDVPVILITGSQSEETAVECMREGAEDYILKSSLKLLPTSLQRACKKAQSERERKSTETAFRRSQEQFRLITGHTRDLISVVDLEFRFLYVSPSHKTVLGYEPDALLNLSTLELIHPDDVRLLQEALDEARFFRTSRQAELRFKDCRGNWHIFESAANYIFEEDGRPQRALIVSRDMSDRKRAEREIRKLAAFPRYNPNPVLEFASDGSLTYFNDAALEMTRSLSKNHPQALLPLNTANIVKRCLSTGQSKLRVENSVNRRTVSWSFFPVMSNQVVHCYAEDVTDRQNLEAQVRQIQKMESVGQLAAGVAHDFNNILTIIQGHSGLLYTDSSLSPEAMESVRQVTLAAERAANLTRQLLMFSRKQIMQPHLLDLNEVINNVSKMLRTLLGEHVRLDKNLASELPAIYADAGMLEQILVNLAVNARDAMHHGGVLTIETEALEISEEDARPRPEAQAGCFVRLRVSDTGTGMDKATLSRVFEPFFTTKEVGKGTGLGLATVYGIVKQHQGWVEVDSEVGKGTTFCVYLAVQSKAPLKTKDASQSQVPGGLETILVVEDEPALRELVTEILRKKGYQVIEASNGVKALEIWKGQKGGIDLLLTDMMMPEGVSGRELAEKTLADKPDLKILYTSGYSLDVISKEFVCNDGINFLQKPYHPEVLAQSVRDCLDALPVSK